MLEFLKRNQRVHELLLCAWGEIEFNVDQLVARQFGLHCDYYDKKVRFLLDSSLARKLDFLKDIGAIQNDELQAVHAFRKRRNELFHSQGWGALFMMSKNEKEQVMDEALRVAQLTLVILSR